MALPSGAVCFVFTDIEGSTSLLADLGRERWAAVLDTHLSIIRGVTHRHGGAVVHTEGDGCFLAFADARAAVLACAEAQVELGATSWPAGVDLRIRMGMHVGVDVEPTGDDYVDMAVHQAARVSSAARGGQVLASPEAVASSGLDERFTALGWYAVRDFSGPVQLHALIPPGGLDAVASPRVPPAAGEGLPRYRTSFVGREDEQGEVLKHLGQSALVTLVGPGGVGKTRLAIAAATQLVGPALVATWFADLTTTSDDTAVDDIVSRAVDRPPDVGLADHLGALLGQGHGLLIVDNCEHVIDAAAEAIDAVLAACPNVSVLATSREPLRLPDEVIVRLRPLDLPDVDDPQSVLRSATGRLFIERAERARPDLELDADLARSVHTICHGVEGLPLAVELAAALCADVSPAEVARRLSEEGGLTPFDDVGTRGRAARHTSLTALIDWSVGYLSADDRKALAALSVPEPPITPALAHASLDALGPTPGHAALARLVARSLVDEGPDGTYRELVAVRERARALVAPDVLDAVRRGVAGACVDICRASAGRLHVVDVVEGTASSLIAELSLDVALRQALAAGLGRWWTDRLSRARAVPHLAAAIALDPESDAAGELHCLLGYALIGTDTERGLWHLDHGLEMIGGPGEDPRTWAEARLDRAWAALFIGDVVGARSIIESERPRGVLPERWRSLAATLASLTGDHEAAEANWRVALETPGVHRPDVLLSLANMMHLTSRPAEAIPLLDEILQGDVRLSTRLYALDVVSECFLLLGDDRHEAFLVHRALTHHIEAVGLVPMEHEIESEAARWAPVRAALGDDAASLEAEADTWSLDETIERTMSALKSMVRDQAD